MEKPPEKLPLNYLVNYFEQINELLPLGCELASLMKHFSNAFSSTTLLFYFIQQPQALVNSFWCCSNNSESLSAACQVVSWPIRTSAV